MRTGNLKKAFTAALAFTGAYVTSPAPAQDQTFTDNNFALTDKPVQPSEAPALSNVVDFSEPLPISRTLGSPEELAGSELDKNLGGSPAVTNIIDRVMPKNYLGDPDELAGNEFDKATGGSPAITNIIDRVMPKGYLGDHDELAGNKSYGVGDVSDLPTGKIRNESTKGYFTVSGEGAKPSASFSETFTDGKSCVARAGALTAAFGRSVEGVCLGEKSNSLDASVICNNEEQYGLPVPLRLPVCKPSTGP